VNRDRREAAIAFYIAKVLLLPEAIGIAKRAYQEAIQEDFAIPEHERVKHPDTLHAEEAKQRSPNLMD
jgi:hypothetical protein